MQCSKDTFYTALRGRLAVVNSQRTVMLEGIAQPAIVVAENEAATASPDHADCFYLRFGAVKGTQGFARSDRPLLELECSFSYRTRGTADGAFDRGRAMAALDREVMAVCEPASTPKFDYTQPTPVPLGTRIFWARPQLQPVTEAGPELSRTATTIIFFYPEEATA